MRKPLFLGIAPVAGAVALVSLYAGAQQVGGDGREPSRCLGDAAIQATSNPATVTLGQSSIIGWSVALPSGCANVSVHLNGQPVARSGSRSVTPARSSSYTVLVSETHRGMHGQASRSTQVEVTYPPRVVIDAGTRNPVDVLLGALGSPNEHQVVELCNVDLDFTGITGITVGSNRSLIASPACARGPRSYGPRIFVTDKRGDSPLFVIRGDSVRFSGFRLEGPTRGSAQGAVKEKGILIFPFGEAGPIHNIEISNMEIFHWSGVGVQVRDNTESAERGRLFNTNPGAVRVRGSFFHHNRHGAGHGYGIASTAGAYVTIEQNVFDENRHAIAGGSVKHSRDYSGYTVRDNLILPGGGLHCADATGRGATLGGVLGGLLGGVVGGILGGVPGAAIGAGAGAGIGAGGGAALGSVCWQTHQIDMHGDDNRFYGGSNWQCGTAGETMIIERNTVLYTRGNAIKIRGNPSDKVVVDGNVFKDDRGHAITQNGYCGWGDNITRPIDVRPNNVFGADPATELGSCDFFGDGRQEQFMATGVTWWARSPVTRQWRYLNTMKERLPQLLLLKRGDGDAVCDVAMRTPRPEIAPRTFSRSGTGPWKQVLVAQE
jgi:hypothetical protein